MAAGLVERRSRQIDRCVARTQMTETFSQKLPPDIEAKIKAAAERKSQAPTKAKAPGRTGAAKKSDIRWPDIGKGRQPAATCANARLAIDILDIDCRYDVF